ncbi:MAG: Fic family protein [Clostridium baratii]|nr:Fic family protein [Clostridium baratii]MDU4912862.1 Fic family protein [Clostridium baratii]
MMNYNYGRFLRILKETRGLKNSLNEVLKYDFIYNSNKIEGSTFTIETLQMLREKNIVTGTHRLDDIYETSNSFYVFDLVIDSLNSPLTLEMIKEWHSSLMYRTRLYNAGLAGVFKKYPNKILGVNLETTAPLKVENNLNTAINKYNNLSKVTIEDIARFHLEFEKIHPFQDGNGRIGRFIFLKQLVENKLPLKYMSGETPNEYKKALAESRESKIDPLIKYIRKQKDFIEENKSLF